ncbi:hypothetical protein HAHE_15420 [Haloferula helveola]|uniref:PEP-CTERM sorting domain-containing protein n=1 Tax=Haloferula helveola TaxID=490095 RepID=A0ABN6H5C1_9BACT|nr:hypothetical protein HAHE_15420 [Haloferula helveola]
MTPRHLLAALLTLGSTHAATLLELDFSGSGAVGSFNSTDAQFTTVDPVFAGSPVISTIGGSAGTASWVYDGTGTAATNPDLHTASTFGGPSRIDLALGVASTGQSYTITSIEIDIRASNSTGTTWEIGYRKPDTSTVLLGSQPISVQGGTDPLGTYSIDLSGESLTATDSTLAWVEGGTGNLRLLFHEPTSTGNDNFQIAGIRVIGTAVPEPTLLALVAPALLLFLRRRRTAPPVL